MSIVGQLYTFVLFALLAGSILPADAFGQAAPPAPNDAAAARAKPLRDLMSEVRSWGYQLQKVEPEVIARSPYDLVVVDYSRAGTDDERFTPSDVRQMQARPDGGRRIVLAYLSIGEAESYRYYWTDEWIEVLKVIPDGDVVEDGQRQIPKSKSGQTVRRGQPRDLHIPRLSAPAWLGRENFTWGGNYLVRYWEKGWQDLIFGGSKTYLERIIEAGFDGVYLDRVDAYYGVQDDRPGAKADMVSFVVSLAARARAIKPGFLIVPQNGEELLLEPAYLATIDGIAKEDLLIGHNGRPNSSGTIALSVDWLNQARKFNRPVLVVEYQLGRDTAERLRSGMVANGYIPYFGVRTLDRLVLPADLVATPAKTPAAAQPPAKKK